MAKGKNKPYKAPKRGPNQPPNRLPKLPRRAPHRDAVLSIPELLEAILLHVDMRTLLVSAQRVATHWHDLITSSPRLQRRLFFAPDHPSDSTTANSNLPKPPILLQNPLLASSFPCLFTLTHPPNDDDDDKPPTDEQNPPPSRLPPCQTPQGVPWQFRAGLLPGPCTAFNPAHTRAAYRPREILPMADMRDRRARHLAFVRRGASWRRMLLSQPPVAKVARVVSARGLRRDPGRRGHLVEVPSAEGGLRMGEFYDAVCAVNWEGRRESYFRLGAWVAWRGTCMWTPAPGVVGGCEGHVVRKGGGTGASGSSGLPGGGWLAEADLVIGEHDADTKWYRTDRCTSHSIWGDCYLTQQTRSVFLCEEYEPRGRLWVPRDAEDEDSDSD